MKKNLIFLVDDDEIQISIMGNYLKNKFTNYEVKSFLTGEDCLNSLDLAPAIIILDYHLDGINSKSENGLEILKKVKASSPEIEVIMVTKNDDEEIAMNCINYGATDYIIKNRVSYIHVFFTLQIITSKLQSDKRARESRFTTLAAACFFGILFTVAMLVKFPF